MSRFGDLNCDKFNANPFDRLLINFLRIEHKRALVRILARQVAHQGHRLVVGLAVDHQEGEAAGRTVNGRTTGLVIIRSWCAADYVPFIKPGKRNK